jgi:hypothetical protein
VNADGAPIFKSSKASAWPLMCAIAELPARTRFNVDNMIAFVYMSFFWLFPHCDCVPQYHIGLLQSEWEGLDIHVAVDNTSTVDYTPLEFYKEAFRDVNITFGENSTLLAFYTTSSADPRLVTVRAMEMLSGSSPVIALIGPFHVETIRVLAPLAESSRSPLIVPIYPCLA